MYLSPEPNTIASPKRNKWIGPPGESFPSYNTFPVQTFYRESTAIFGVDVFHLEEIRIATLSIVPLR